MAPLEHAATRAITAAERAVSRGLGGSCQVPLAAYAEIEGDTLRLRAIVGNHKTGEHVAVAGDDAAAVKWFPLDQLPELAFDHGEIVNDIIANIGS